MVISLSSISTSSTTNVTLSPWHMPHKNTSLTCNYSWVHGALLHGWKSITITLYLLTRPTRWILARAISYIWTTANRWMQMRWNFWATAMAYFLAVSPPCSAASSNSTRKKDSLSPRWCIRTRLTHTLHTPVVHGQQKEPCASIMNIWLQPLPRSILR